MDDFRASSDNPIPVFLEKAINFIEKEGLDAEGLYRVKQSWYQGWNFDLRNYRN